MIEFKVDVDTQQLDAFVSAFFTKSALSTLTAGIAANARDSWIRRAGEQLNTSRRDYVNGIQAVQRSGTVARIALEGSFANMIEQGTLGFDLRETLLRQFGLRSRVIPFRHRTPDSAGHTGSGVPMGHAYKGKMGELAGAALGKAIYKQASKLKPGQALPEGLAPKLKESHTTDLYAGMQRMRTGQTSGQTRYMTFRTISEDSPPDSWLYPPLAPKRIAESVVAELPAIASQIIDALLGGIGGP